MSAWCCRLRRRAALLLACLLLAIAVAPVASVEAVPERPHAALLLRLGPVAAVAAQALADSRAARVARVGVLARVSDDAGREPRVPRARARGRSAPDERYLYLLHGKLLC